MQDRALQVPQGRMHLRVLTMSWSVFKRRAPEPTGRSADGAGSTNRVYGDREEKQATREHKGREDSDSCGRRGERERTGQRQTHTPSTNGNHQTGAMARGRRRPDVGTRRWGKGQGGKSKLNPNPGGPPSPGGLRKLGPRQPRHTP